MSWGFWENSRKSRGSPIFVFFLHFYDQIVQTSISLISSYRQLSEMVNRLGNLFRSHGIGRGDIVAIYLPVSPLVVATMLACARIGAIHSVVFAGFSSQALSSRIQVMFIHYRSGWVFKPPLRKPFFRHHSFGSKA